MNRMVLVGGAFVSAMLLAWILFVYVLPGVVEPMESVAKTTSGSQVPTANNVGNQPKEQAPTISKATQTKAEVAVPDVVFTLLAIAPVVGKDSFGVTLRVNDDEHAFYNVGDQIAGLEATLESAELQRAVIDHDGKKVILELPIPVRPKSQRSQTEDESILSLPSRQGFDAF